jgi:hypothetical protein
MNSLFKVLFNFPSRYLSTIGLVAVFSLRWSLPPASGCTLKQPDSKARSDPGALRRPLLAWHHLRAMAPFKGDLDRHVRPGNEAGPYATTPIRAATQKCAAGFGDGLFPVRSPLLGESRLFSFPPLINMLKSGG